VELGIKTNKDSYKLALVQDQTALAIVAVDPDGNGLK
jgi:hypothetical protein